MSEEKNHYNVAVWDSIIRITIGVVVLAASAFVPTFGWQLAMGIVAYLIFATGVFSFCPMYTLFGSNTARSDTLTEWPG